jgi:hypothetical protein
VNATRTVGIVTITDDGNIGNRLQNFALAEALRGLGWDAETIRNRPQSWPRDLLLPRILEDVRHRPRALLAHAPVPRRVPLAAPRHADDRRRAIEQFTASRIRTSDALFHDLPGPYWSDRYDKLVVGSDQVWNPQYRRAQGLDFLDFAAPDKRIAYAASFGVARVPRFLQRRYAAWLTGIPHLSVREQAGAEIVRRLTGRIVPIVADPTMLVDRAVWDDLISDEARAAEGSYTVRYVLGEPDASRDAAARRVAGDHAADVIDLTDLDSAERARIGPAGFVAAIARSSLVVSDSFHATVFGLLYGRPVLLCRRFAGDSRTPSLLAELGVIAAPAAPGILVVRDYDATAVDARIEARRASSRAFLRAALDSA